MSFHPKRNQFQDSNAREPLYASAKGEELLDSCLADNKIAVLEWDLATDTFKVSPYFYQMFLLEKEQQISRRNIFQLLSLSGKQTEQLRLALDEFKDNPSEFAGSMTLVHRNGAERNIFLRFKPAFHHDQLASFYGYIQELSTATDNKATSFAKRMMNFSSRMVFWVNPDFSIQFANHAALKTLGYTEDDLMTGPMWRNLSIDASADALQNVFERIKIEKSFSIKTKLRRKDGTVVLTECHYSYIDMEQGSFVYVAANEAFSRPQSIDEEAARHATTMESLRLHWKVGQQSTAFKQSLEAAQCHLITINAQYKKLVKHLEDISQLSCPVLINGEAGTGKNLLAKLVHQMSAVRTGPLVQVDCREAPPKQLESKLFGPLQHKRSKKDEGGLVEQATGGILLLNEIGDLSPRAQAKLVQLIEDGTFAYPGNGKARTSHVRIVATSRQDLHELVKEKRFSGQLLDHFRKGMVHNPPLRERPSDIPVLAGYFLKKHSQKLGKNVLTIAPDAMQQLYRHHFPGNVRELETIIEEAIRQTDGTRSELHEWRAASEPVGEVAQPTISSLEEVQRQHILKVLKMTDGKVSGKNGAANLLGINAQTLFSKIRKLGIKLP